LSVARTPAGRKPRAAFLRRPGPGRVAKATSTDRSVSEWQSPRWGKGGVRNAGHATLIVPRTGATAGEAATELRGPGQAWLEERAQWQAAVQASWEPPETARRPARAGGCAW